MGYQIQIEGGLPGGGQSELHHVREAIGKAVAELQEKGHQMSTSFIKHPSLTTPRDEAHNFQDPSERGRYQQESDDWNGVMRQAREESMRMSSGAAQRSVEDLPGQDPVREDRPESTSPLSDEPTPTSSDVGSVQTTVVDRGSGTGAVRPQVGNAGPPQTPKVTEPTKAPADKPTGSTNPAPPSP